MTTTVGFVGLGHMGGPMAANLVSAGYDVHGFDLAEASRDRAARDGVRLAASAADAATDADVVITMLPNGRLVLDVYDEVLTAAAPGTMFVDSSTIDVADARQANAIAVSAGFTALDAPVSGGVGGASAATLTFMVGGAEGDVARARALLNVMGNKVVHCGAAGNGQAAKVCNNMILGISMIAVSEAFVLGEKLGLTNQALFEVAGAASGQCWALTTNCPVPGPVPTSPANNGYKPGFSAALMTKDLGLAANALRANGVDGELGLLATSMYEKFAEESGGQDFSAIVNAIRERSA